MDEEPPAFVPTFLSFAGGSGALAFHQLFQHQPPAKPPEGVLQGQPPELFFVIFFKLSCSLLFVFLASVELLILMFFSLLFVTNGLSSLNKWLTFCLYSASQSLHLHAHYITLQHDKVGMFIINI